MTVANRNLFRVAAICQVLVAAPLAAEVKVHLAGPTGPVLAGTDVLLKPEVTGAGAETGVDWAMAEDFDLVGEAEGVSVQPQGPGVFLFRASAARPRTLQVRATARADRQAFVCITIQVEPRAGAGDSKGSGGAGAGAVESKRQGIPRLAGGEAATAVPVESKATAGLAPEDQTEVRLLFRQDPGTPWLWETPFGQRQKHIRFLDGFGLDLRPALPEVVALESWPDRSRRLVRIDLHGKVMPVADPFVLPKDAPPVPTFIGANVVVAPDGAILVAPIFYSRILRVAPDGAVSLLADADGPIELQQVYGLAVTAGGDVVFSDALARRVYRLDHASRRKEVLAGTAPVEGAESRIRNDLSLESPAAATTLEYPRGVAVLPDGRILVSDRLGVLAIHRDGIIRRITPAGVWPELLAASPDNRVYFTSIHTLGRTLCRLESDGTVTSLNQEVIIDGSVPHYHQRLASSSHGIANIGPFAVLPGGAILFKDGHPGRLTLMGTAPSDESLAKLVRDGVRAALQGPWATAVKIRDGLLRRANQDLDNRTRLEMTSKDVGGQLPKVLPQPLVRMIGRAEGADPRGLAFRAWVALYVLDRETRARNPKLADQLAAFPRRATAAAGSGAGVTESKAGAVESKASGGESKAGAGASRKVQ